MSFASSSLGSSPQPPDAQHTPALTNGASHAWPSSSDPSTRPSHPHPPQSHPHQPLPAPTPHALRPGASNYATATLRAWHTSAPPELGLAPHDTPLARSGLGPVVGVNGSGTSIGPVHCAPSPPPAPAPRPTRVASVSARAIHARIVAGGRWGVFVVKRAPGSGLGLANAKGKQRADGVSLTVEALAHLRQDGAELSKKGKARAVPIDEEPVAQWAEKAAASAATAISAKSDGDTFVVIYDLDAVDGPHENGMMAEHPMKWSPAVMACRATSTGVVIVLASGPKEAVPYTTILKWSYQSPNITHLSSHKSKCPLGVMSIQEYQDGKTLVAIVHRPTTVMIQDIDTSRRCFVKLSKLQPRHTLQAVQLIPGPHLLVIRKVQSDDPDGHSYALEEYGLPPMGESVHPTKPLQRQWIRGMDLHSITLCEGPSYEGDARPDIALWGYSTLPNRAMVHWILSAGPKDGMTTTPDSGPVNDIPSAHPTETLDQPPSEVSVEPDIYSDNPETVYRFPIEHVSTNRLSFPHHKATLAPGVRRALWFERPERSRTGEARGMRGVWAYTSVERKEGLWNRKHREEREGPVVRNCTRELPEDVLNSMESNTLSVAFDESSGRAIVLTCGDSYGAASGSRIWVLDYA